jgi:hypothetical protein
MNVKIALFCAAWAASLIAPLATRAQSQASSSQDTAPSSGQEKPGRGPREGQRGPAVVGKITSLQEGAMQITKPNGESVTVKWTGQTEFRKAREAAKLSDFKVGDGVLVRGEENEDHSWTARVIILPSGDGRGNGGAPIGEMGQDFVVGEVKGVDAPKLTILRTDKVTQTIELTEESSLRRGRDSITMADLQPGDHVFVRGGMQGKVFVPKILMVIEPEQWKQMQEMGFVRRAPADAAPKAAPAPAPPEQNR